ncbi:hypothetical protein [Lachnospira multipara]|nr:hypothetical protein [Lachnospira multipara]
MNRLHCKTYIVVKAVLASKLNALRTNQQNGTITSMLGIFLII